MPSKDWSEQLRQVNFQCGACRRGFSGVPDLVEDDPATPWHPHRYYASCPRCSAAHQPQANWERALMKAHHESTGPISQEARSASASNLAGHPTPAEARLTRFNAMKHGMQARVATFFPARPGKYSFCETCDVDPVWCANQPACVKQTELFMLHHAAVEQRDPKHLGRIHADLMGALTAALQMCLQTVLADGVVIKAPKVELSREGVPVTLSYTDANGETQFVYDYHSNPAFKPIADLVSRLGLSMSDLGLTYKAAEDDDPAGVGALQLEAGDKESLEAFGKRMGDAMLAMRERLQLAQANKRKDPVLIEHEANGDAT